ncbi:MAG: PQQ-binding-like beta-propeller repeat protein [Verrucomicrobiota bacterium]
MQMRTSTSHSLRAICAGAILGLSPAVLAEDWPAWGGSDPGRNMYSPAKGFPAEFNPGKFKPNSEDVDLSTTKNVKWVAKLGSQTYGNPVVANGKVYVGTNNATPRDDRFKDDRSILMTLNEYTGEFLWQLVVPKLASGKVNDWEYLGLLSSPLVEGDKLYVVTSRCEVVCLDANGQANGNQGFAKGGSDRERCRYPLALRHDG